MRTSWSRRVNERGAPDFGAACDGDGDRNMISAETFVTPGDCSPSSPTTRACIPGFREGFAGVARSMPTSAAVDRVAQALGLESYEIPTGWKFFGNLFDAGRITLCGEESFGTGSNHVREKDGLWAVLCWLSILAVREKSVEEIVRDHWRRFGRSYYQRHDYEGLNAAAASAMVEELRENLNSLAGTTLAGGTVARADDFSYTDPVDGSTTAGQGIRIFLEDGSRVVLRLSGTGTSGATLRIYLERFRDDGGDADISEVLSTMTADVREMLRLRERFGTDEPTVVT